jgi:hypothetical protein
MAAFLVLVAGCAADPGGGDPGADRSDDDHAGALRVAQFNIRELTTAKLLDPQSPQVRAAAEVIARFDADVLCLNEIQYDLAGVPDPQLPGDAPAARPGALSLDGDGAGNAARLGERVAEVDPELRYAHSAVFLGNSGFAFEGNPAGKGAELFAMRGFGEFEGRFNTGVLSRFPIRADGVRVIADFPWHDLPGNRIAELEAELGVKVPAGFPLFEKALHIVPIEIGAAAADGEDGGDQAELLYLILLHPVSSGFNDLNPFRNADELHALALFLSGELPGVEPLPEGARFLVIGDLNSDPEDGESPGSVNVVADHPRVAAHFPTGDGGEIGTHPERNTFLSGCGRDGAIVTKPSAKLQLQLDYLLPSVTLGEPVASGIFWPHHQTDPDGYALACRASDHRHVFVDLPGAQ